MIQCQNVFKCYGKKQVLSGIIFDIEDGQIFGLLGPSGAGKTTLIKILTGQLPYDSGKISSEPTLETIFLELTGRKLEEDK